MSILAALFFGIILFVIAEIVLGLAAIVIGLIRRSWKKFRSPARVGW